MTTTERACARCGASLEGKRSDATYCSRRCKNAKWHAVNAEKVKAKNAKYYTVNAEKVRANHAKWHAVNAEKVRAKVHSVQRARQRASVTRAERNGLEWTSAELEAVARYDHSAAELARILGRTIYAVETARRRINAREPKIMYLLGEASDRSSDRMRP